MILKPDRVTVVIPIYNDAENLRYCLAAIMQARKSLPVDIIVVNDGSTDNSAQVAKSFDVNTVINLPVHSGQSHARNVGAKKATSEYVLFVDADVIVPNNCFEDVANFLSAGKTVRLIGMQGVFSLTHPFRKWSSLYYNTLQHLLSRSPRYNYGINTSWLLISRQAFWSLGGFDEKLWFMEDNELAQRMRANGQYIQHGPVQFIHRKKIGFSWLFGTHLLGGKMQYALGRLRPKTRAAIGASPHRVRCNHHFLKLTVTTPWLVTAFWLSATTSRHSLSFLFGLFLAGALVSLLPDIRALWTVRKNPLFVLFGVMIFLCLPWLIIWGRICARLWPAGTREQSRWQSSNTNRTGQSVISNAK